MNTAVKIKSCTRASAVGKNEYNLERTKNREKDILVLEKNELPKENNVLSLEQKKEIKSLQTKLSTYKKRLEKAIANSKEKSIKTNSKNIEKITEQLSKIEKSDKREKYFTEFTIALTNSKKNDYADTWSKSSLEFIKKEFPGLDVVSAVEHKDQHSPHMHILLHSKEKPITQVLAEHTGQKDTKRESMKEAYSTIAHNFHAFANAEIAHKELKPLQKGRKYVSLGQYKQKGNFEAKIAFKAKKESLLELNRDTEKLKKQIQDAERVLCTRYLGKETLKPIEKKTAIFKRTYHFIEQSDVEDIKRELQGYLRDGNKYLGIKNDENSKVIDEYFYYLEKNSKKIHARRYDHWEKSPALKLDLKYFEKWKNALNDYLKKLDQIVKEKITHLAEKKNQVDAKIKKHPQTIMRNKKLNFEREEYLAKMKTNREIRNSKKDRGLGR